MKIVYTGEKDTRLFKEALGQTIGRLLEEDPDVLYLDADLMSCIGTAKLPGKTDRAIDCGIAEANMVGIAARSLRGLQAHRPFLRPLCLPSVLRSGLSVRRLRRQSHHCHRLRSWHHRRFQRWHPHAL